MRSVVINGETVDGGIQNKTATIKDYCNFQQRYSSDCIPDAMCILMVENELERFYLDNDLSLNVFIAGPTCSGKTTLAKRIELYFKMKGFSVVTIHQDDYYKDLKQVSRCYYGYYMDGLDAFHVEELENDFRKLIADGGVRVPHYEIKCNKRIGYRPYITRGKINIVEGLHVVEIFRQTSNGIFFYMNTSLETCLERRIARDTSAIGVSPERVKEYFSKCIMPMYERDILPQYHLTGIANYYRYLDQ